VDHKAGTVNGVPAVMASSWGKSLGVVQLALQWDGAKWTVNKAASKSELRNIQSKNAAGTTVTVDADTSVAPLIETQHQAAIQYVKTPIGQTDFRMSTLFADVGDPGAIQIVNQAQQAYVAAYLKASLPQYAQLPVLSVSAPFKSGFQGGADYTDVAVGPLAINNAADLYLYPNTVYAVKVNGGDIKNWLEAAAKRFNQIDPAKTGEQQLISTFPGYNFDMFTTADVQYEIDVTKPVGSRIQNLSYLGKPIDVAQEFVIATNNYRATSGKSFIDKLDGSGTIWASPDANRDVVIEYVRKNPAVTRTGNGAAKSWRFAKATVAGPVVFSSGANGLSVAQAAGLSNVTLVAADDGSGKGTSKYAVDLSK
ncbi:MAG: bifunctional metallophosphatase/5'-nucleotidase, partial [Acidovorax sp.]